MNKLNVRVCVILRYCHLSISSAPKSCPFSPGRNLLPLLLSSFCSPVHTLELQAVPHLLHLILSLPLSLFSSLSRHLFLSIFFPFLLRTHARSVTRERRRVKEKNYCALYSSTPHHCPLLQRLKTLLQDANMLRLLLEAKRGKKTKTNEQLSTGAQFLSFIVKSHSKDSILS